MAKLRGLHSGHEWVSSKNRAAQLMADPEAFFREYPQKTSEYACPEEVHEALAKGRRLGEEMTAACAKADAAGASPVEAAKALRETVSKHLGKDFVAETIPFGILFKERAAPGSLGITGTGSCTFCKDNDSPDVDG